MKNLKMFAIALLSMLVMASGVYAAEENPCKSNDGKIYASIDGKAGKCYTDLDAVITELNKDEHTSAEVKLYSALTSVTKVDVSSKKSLTLDLNGNDITATSTIFTLAANSSLTIKSEYSAKISSNTNNLFLVDGGRLNINGKVTLESTAQNVPDDKKKAMIAVKGNREVDKTEVNVGKDVTVTSKSGAGLIVYSDKGTESAYETSESTGVVVNVAGTWDTKLYTVSVHGQVIEGSNNNPVINVSEGKFTSSDTIAFYASGYGEWNIKGGEITGKDAFKYRTGKVVIEGDAKLTGTGKVDENPAGTSGGAATGSAFVFSKDNRGPITDSASTNVKFNGGTFKSESADGYAIYFESLARVKGEEAVIEINSGSYTSKGKKAAIGFGTGTEVTSNADDFLENHEGFVKGGEFANEIATVLGDYPAQTIAGTLTKGTEFTTQNGNVVVGNGAKAPEQNPDDQQGNTGDNANTPGDTNPNVPDVPKTNDNILVYAGLGLVSALTVSFSAKRKENN